MNATVDAAQKPRILVIVATYNELDNLPQLLQRLWDAVDVDVLVVDDSSPDGTGELADRIAADDARITVVHRNEKGGVASAHLLGFRHALAHGYDRVCWRSTQISRTRRRTSLGCSPRALLRTLPWARAPRLEAGSSDDHSGATW